MLDVSALALPDVLLIVPPRHSDDRGFFSETWSAAGWAAAGIDTAFVQDNHSYSAAAGVLRGLHYQLPPMAQDKLIRVTRGSVFDVAVDIRRGSPTFARWVGVTLSAREGNQLLIPKGFAHGFLTLEPDTEVQYKVSAPYSAAHDRGIRFDDAEIGVAWPWTAETVQLSPKDRVAPYLSSVDTGFTA